MKHFYLLLLFISTFSYSQVHTSYLWHLQQPTYWPDKSVDNPYEYQKVWESNVLKFNGGNNDVNGIAHPTNDLQEIFSKPDRVNVYQWETYNSMQSIAHLPEAGVQVNYGGCLIENINSLADAGQWGYQNNWQQSVINGQNTLTSDGYSRLSIMGFTWHHSLSPLLSDRVFRKELQAHKNIVQTNFNGDVSKGYWPAECAFSERAIKVLVEEGFEWSIVANSHLARTLNDYEANTSFGTNGMNIDPPNKADKISTNGVNWFNGQIDGRGGSFAAPYCYQVHKAKYVDPETGTEYKIDVVPMADLLSYKDGFSEQSTSDIDTYIAPYNDASQPSLVLFAHDGDNAWGGGASYYQSAVPNFSNAANAQGYVPSNIQEFIDEHPTPSTIVHVEDGAWVNAANDWGHPQFLNWMWPFYDANYEFNPTGWTEDARNWAVLTAAENFVVMAEDLEPNVQINDIVNPTSSSSDVELAWHFLLPGYTSGYMYYGTAEDMEVKQTVAANNAVGFAQNVIDNHAGTDTTSPSVFIPQRYPYNPGEIGFGPNYGYQQHLNNANFTVWTFAFDVNGIASAKVKYRVDNDGNNPLNNNDNETYAGGGSVGSWEEVTMTERIFPKGNVANNPEVDFYILPDYIANQYHGEIVGLSEVLVDYYVEVIDVNGNTTKSKIQHVWVGTNLQTKPVITIDPDNTFHATQIDVTITATDDITASPTIYYTIDDTEPTTSSPSATGSVSFSVTQTTTVKAFAVDEDGQQSDVVSKKFNIGVLDDITVYFKPGTGWPTPQIYWWDAIPVDSAGPSSWPGIDMQIHDSDWFKYVFSGVQQVNVIFNNGSGGAGNQTEDLVDITSDIWYEWGVGTVLSVDQNELESNNIYLYPNPTSSKFSINLFADKVEIFDTAGRKVKTFEEIISTVQMDISDLSDGIYFIKITTPKGTGTKQLIKN